MDLKIKEIKELVKMAKDENLEKLHIKTDDMDLSFSFPQAPIYTTAPVSQVAHAAPVQEQTQAVVSNSKFHEIKSKYVGTFYTAANPESAPYVKVGDTVKKGQVLCLVEAMKIFSEIKADVNGKIVEICLENDSVVEYDQVVFRIEQND